MISTDLLRGLIRATPAEHRGPGMAAAPDIPDEAAFGRFFIMEGPDGESPPPVAPQPFPLPVVIPARSGAVEPEAVPVVAPEEEAAEIARDAHISGDVAILQPVPFAAPAHAMQTAGGMDGALGTAASFLRKGTPGEAAQTRTTDEDAGVEDPAVAGALTSPAGPGPEATDRRGPQAAAELPRPEVMPSEAAPVAEPAVEPMPAALRTDGPAATARPPAPVPASSAASPSATGLTLAPAEVEPGWRLGIEPAAALPREIPAAPAPAAPQAAVANQVAMAIRTGEGERIEIRLDPPELGRVQIEMRAVEGTLHAVVVAERPEIGDILRRHAELLQRDLEAAGYASVSIEFAAGREREGSGEHHGANRDAADTVFLAEATAPIQPAHAAALDRLDIRL